MEMVGKILFLATATGGNGGHYHSLSATARFASSFADVAIATVGTRPFDHFATIAPYRHFGHAIGVSPLFTVQRHVRSEGFNILHAFDTPSFLPARIAAARAGAATVLTMCGGPKIEGYYPKARNQIVFSPENLASIEARKFRPERLEVLPNRVETVRTDPELAMELRQRLTSGSISLMRISRFNAYYRKSIVETLALGDALRAEGMPVEVIMLGTVQDNDFFAELQAASGPHVHFVTEPRFTEEASRCLDAADMVVGTGRGAMEAASLGKVLFASAVGHDLPVLVTPENVAAFTDFNFSERSSIARDQVPPIKAVLAIAADARQRVAYGEAMKDVARERFLLAGVRDRYIAFYKTLVPERTDVVDWIGNANVYFRPFLNKSLISRLPRRIR